MHHFIKNIIDTLIKAQQIRRGYFLHGIFIRISCHGCCRSLQLNINCEVNPLFRINSDLQNSNTSLLFWNLFTGLKFLNKLNIKSSLSQNSQYHSAIVSWPHIYSASSRSQHTLFTLRLRNDLYCVEWGVKLYSLTHALHPMLISSNHHHHSVTHRFFRHASPHLWNQLPTSLKIPHLHYSSPSQQPSFEHAGLTCYTLLSPSITFSQFHSKLKTYLFRNLILHLSLFLSVRLISWL